MDKILRQVHLQPPWTVEEFRAWLAHDLGISIELRPSEPGASPLVTGECGLLVVSGRSAVIWYDSSRSPRHQRQQVFHEFAHLLCKHDRSRPLASALRSGEHPLVAGMSKELRERMFGPALEPPAMPDTTEAEAELVGTKLAVLSVSEDAARPRRNYERVLSLWGGRA